MGNFSNIRNVHGDKVYTYDFIERLREQDKKNSEGQIVAQAGGQESMLSSPAAIKIGGGSRGGAKSFSLLMETLADINDPNFNGLILRNERPDLENIINDSYRLYSQFGFYNKSISDMTWYFKKGGKLLFSYYNDPNYREFQTRFQGKQYCYIGIDEITQMPYNRFKYLLTDNRNAHGIPNRIFGTCNPDPDSWVRQFIDWWIGEDGFPIPERDGVMRWCYMDGNNPNSIYWGDTPEEVYEQCREIIDPLWKPEYTALGLNPVTAFVQSVCFVKSSLEDNRKLLLSDPSYLSRLGQQGEEQMERDLRGNWNFKDAGDDMIKMSDLEAMFKNTEQTDNNQRFASCDIAFSGGDNLVMWLWNGWHIEDVYVCRNDAKTQVSLVKEKLKEWGVFEKNFVYDLNGIGQAFQGFFPDAVPFNNMAAPIPSSSREKNAIRGMYGNLKSQAAFLFAGRIKKGLVSINRDLLDRKFSGNGYEKMPLRQILNRERKCIRANTDRADGGFTLIPKKVMKKYVGHSPDFFESLIFREIFEIKRRNNKPKGLWLL